MTFPNTRTTNGPSFWNICVSFALKFHPRCLLPHKQTKHRSLSQEVYHPTTQDSSSSHKQSLSSCNKRGTEEGRLNCSSTINCSSPASTLPCSRLLQCHCCRGALLCTGAAVRLKQQRYLMGTTWQSCTTSKGVCGGERDV